MRVAIPIDRDRRCADLAACEGVSLIDVDDRERIIVGHQEKALPRRSPGPLSGWLAERGVGLVIVGVLDDTAKFVMRRRGIVVLADAPAWSPERLVETFLFGEIAPGARA